MGATPHRELQLRGIDESDSHVDLGDYSVQQPREGFQTITLPQLGCENLGIEDSDSLTVYLVPGRGLFLEVDGGDE
jgi:hypothetical protein